MKQYHDALQHVLDNGEDRTDRTGVGTRSVFGYQMRFDLSEGFPAVTTKKLAWKAVVSELLWFLEGSTDERRLAEIHYGSRDPSKKTIWTDNAMNQAKDLGYEIEDDYRYMGPIYGKQWREWDAGTRGRGPHTDQIATLVKNIKNDPYSRRHILSAWNVGEVPNMALPPCHMMAQFYVRDDKLDCLMYQRSADMFLGVPFNIASYALLTHMIAQQCTLNVGDFVHSIGDVHIYSTHIDQVREQLTRKPLPLPTLELPHIPSLETHNIKKLKVEDFVLYRYEHYDKITAPMAI